MRKRTGAAVSASGAWLVPTYNGIDYLDKPAFFFKAVAMDDARAMCREMATRDGLHVVGLHVDPADPILVDGLTRNRGGRALRAQRMAAELARLGIPGALEGAYEFADNKDLIGRTHF